MMGLFGIDNFIILKDVNVVICGRFYFRGCGWGNICVYRFIVLLCKRVIFERGWDDYWG